MWTRSKARQKASLSYLESLPDGVLAHVVDHLFGSDDKKALRSVSRRLRGLVDSRVFSLLLSENDSALTELDAVAARWPALLVFHLSGLPSAAGPALGRAAFASLEELEFGEEEIAPDAIMDLAAAMARMPKLRELNLQRTKLGDGGVQALAQVECPSLEDIDLGENGLGPAAVTAIADASNKWPKLRVLNLCGNPQLGAAGAEALCRAVFPCLEK